jgi:hypothetical protein
MNYDSAAWGALAFALSTLLGVVTFFRWRSRGLAAGLRGAGWTILPVAAWLTGVLELGFDVADSIGHWAVHLVFSPVVWLGVVLAGVSAVLFGASALLERRSRTGGQDTPPALDAPKQRRVKGSTTKGRAAIGDDDLDDIEAILRKHGIS